MPRKPVSPADGLPSVVSGESPKSVESQAVADSLHNEDSVLNRMRQESRERLEAIDRLLLAIVREGREPSPTEIPILASAGLTGRDLRKELARCRRVIEADAIAGDAAHRAELEAAVAAAMTRLEERSAEIEAAIRELRAEQQALEAEARNATDARDRAEMAIHELGRNVPKFIEQEAAELRRLAKLVNHEQREAVRVRVHELQTLVNREWFDDTVLDHCRRLPPSHPCYAVHISKHQVREGIFEQTRQDYVPQTAWMQLREEYRKELAELLPIRERFEQELAERLEEVQQKLEWYVRN
jgi:hypothetical protein